MRIIKNFELNSSKKNNFIIKEFSINCIAITNDSLLLAIADSNKLITVFPYIQLENFIKTSSNIKGDKFSLIKDQIDIPKLLLNNHIEGVNALAFSKLNKYFLISGASDKCLMIWKICNEEFSYTKNKLIKAQSDVTDITILPNDEFIFVGCIDNNIYIWNSNFQLNNFELVKSISYHNNFITSICLDPKILKMNPNDINKEFSENGIKLASYSDDGQLIISQTFLTGQGITSKSIKNFEEFVNTKNKINHIQKKIDWSFDGKWVVSVNHHFVNKHKVVHVRLVNMNDVNNPQILIGHDCAVMIAKFSPVEYFEKENHGFSLLATADKNGNLIIWKIHDYKFKILTEIQNLSETNITYLLWSNDGNFLFASNSNGSVYILELNDFKKSQIKLTTSIENFPKNSSSLRLNEINTNSNVNNSNVNNLNRQFTTQKRITPELISGDKVLDNIAVNQAQMTNLNSSKDCLRCHSYKLDLIEQKIVCLKLQALESKNVYFQWENKIYENYSSVQLRMNRNQILFANKFDNKLIVLFTCNNYFYAFFDTNNLLNVFTLFNSVIFHNLYIEEITFIDNFMNYLLFITSDNKLTIMDIFKKEKLVEKFLDIHSTSNNSYSTKITSVKFLNLEKIILYIESYNTSINKKNILLYNRILNMLTKIDNNGETDNIINNTILNNKFLKSPYNFILNDEKLYNIIEENNLTTDQTINDNFKLQAEIKLIEEKFLYYHNMNQIDEFNLFFSKFLVALTKNNLYYRLIDFFIFYITLNNKQFFSILREEDLSNNIKENILYVESIPVYLKDFIRTII